MLHENGQHEFQVQRVQALNIEDYPSRVQLARNWNIFQLLPSFFFQDVVLKGLIHWAVCSAHCSGHRGFHLSRTTKARLLGKKPLELGTPAPCL